MCSEVGFVKALELALRCVPLGLLYAGLPCKSFGFMASHTHGRDGANPWGYESRPFVVEGTLCATRFALIALVGIARGCAWLIEQPSRTALLHLPPIRVLMNYDLSPTYVRWSGP